MSEKADLIKHLDKTIGGTNSYYEFEDETIIVSLDGSFNAAELYLISDLMTRINDLSEK